MRKKSGVRGAVHPNSQLSEMEVRDIFARAETEPYKVIANEYGIHHHTVSNIRNGFRWKHLGLLDKAK